MPRIKIEKEVGFVNGCSLILKIECDKNISDIQSAVIRMDAAEICIENSLFREKDNEQ